jgi:hypothetical protein
VRECKRDREEEREGVERECERETKRSRLERERE